MQDMNGKVVAVTGASSGIGEAIARRLAAQGARVVLGARRTDRLERLGAEIAAADGGAAFTALDVTSRANMKAFIGFALERFGRLDVLVNNAGLMPLSLIGDLKVDEWDRMIDVNLKGVLHGIAAALPVFTAQGSGHFVNISSIADRRIVSTAAIYSGTKYAVRAISEGLRQEVGPAVRVTLVAPGATRSELANTISDPELRRAAIEDYRRDLLPADAIARAVAYAIAEPGDVDVNEIVVRPTAQIY
ncbi:SDR family oxidoreductase [Phreatobacter stygius]|uniref:SDR family oxidoreductase n=1 Tax=Phreatobacter stygius TaxID=1940610 RepID=A0A4D7BDW7_9HYPH|nr:SDR family oxidoreductase [Phreatobacter stygius]QCI66182.1 SDR family oxidoreductase [Phreatobacter stygius]